MINRQFQSLLKEAKNRIEIMTTENGLSNIYSNHFRTLKKLSKKGVKIKIVAPLKNSKLEKPFSEIADLRNTNSPLGRVAVVDGEHFLMSLTDDGVHESQDLALWANSEHAVKSMASPLFNQVWKEAGSSK
jgi:sugar-specific transcriptional regulator TrmB